MITLTVTLHFHLLPCFYWLQSSMNCMTDRPLGRPLLPPSPSPTPAPVEDEVASAASMTNIGAMVPEPLPEGYNRSAWHADGIHTAALPPTYPFAKGLKKPPNALFTSKRRVASFKDGTQCAPDLDWSMSGYVTRKQFWARLTKHRRLSLAGHHHLCSYALATCRLQHRTGCRNLASHHNL